MSIYSLRHGLMALFVAASTAVVAPAMAQQGNGSGEVRRIDADAGKITLKHGPIDALSLPAITLVYLIEKPLLTGIQPGDQVKFTAERQAGDYVIIRLRKR